MATKRTPASKPSSKPAPARKRSAAIDAELLAVKAAASEWSALKQQIGKERGEGIVLNSGDLPRACHIPTGAFTLDFATLGGFPEGHATMLYGVESSGKTTMMLKAVAGYQKKHPDKIVVWVDTESMFDRDWAAQLGCDLSRLELIQPETGEEAVDLLVAAMGALEVGMVIMDSVPGCVPQTILERSAEDQTMAVLARLMGTLCSKILMSWGKERRRGHRVTVGIINQIRLKVGFVLGNPQTLPGGRQINHLPTTKVAIKNKEIKGKDAYENEVILTNDHSFDITKAKHGASIRSGEFQMVISPDLDPELDQGQFDDYKTVLTYAKKFGLLTGGGGAYRIPLIVDEVFGKHEQAIAYFKEYDAPYQRLRASIIACQRFSKGLPMLPPDNYLCGPGVTVPVHALMSLMNGEG